VELLWLIYLQLLRKTDSGTKSTAISQTSKFFNPSILL
jgi:hypothetical protein